MLVAVHAISVPAALLGAHWIATTSFGLGYGLLALVVIARDLRDLGEPRAPRLARLSKLGVGLFVIACGYVGGAMWLNLYSNAAEFSVILPVAGGFVFLLLLLAYLAPRSDAAYYGCVALVLTSCLVGIYCLLAVLELMTEFPDLWSEHFRTPVTVHVFDVAIMSGLAAYCCMMLAGLCTLLLGCDSVGQRGTK